MGGGFRPLHMAAQDGNIDLVKTLIQARADASAMQHQGATALHLASSLATERAESAKAIEVVQMLLEAKAQIRVGRLSAIQLAKGKGYKDIVALLKKHGRQ